MNSEQADTKREQAKIWVRKQLGKAWDGIIGNAAWLFVVFVFGLIAALALVVRSWGLEVAIPVLQKFLSTKVVVTIGSITAITFPILVLAIIWIFFNRKQRLKTSTNAQERETKIIEQDQQIAELKNQLAKKEKLIKQFYDQQESNSKRRNELTGELNELRRELRNQMVFKAIYYDPDYETSWIENPEAVANFFGDRGFEIVNANQLGRWVDERIEHGESSQSCLVFAQDMIPDTVADLRSHTCKLRLFLDAGARVVWHGDVPFWWQGRPGGRRDAWSPDGLELVLGIKFIPVFENSRLNGILTEKGRIWGMELLNPTWHLVSTKDVDDIFTFGPLINLEVNTACTWRKIYNRHHPHSGFLRYWPGPRDGTDVSINADYFRFAVSGWSAVPAAKLPVIKIPRTQVFVSGNKADMFRPANTNSDWKIAAIEPHYEAWIQIPEAQWIWWQDWVTPEYRIGGAVEHKREFELDGEPQQVTLMFAVDDWVENIRVNGKPLGDETRVGNWYQPTISDLMPQVRNGLNILEMTVVNVNQSPTSPDDNPTGLCYRIDVLY